MIRTKICGLSRLCDIEAVNEAKADYAGFVFAQSRRMVEPGQAMKLRDCLAPGIVPVGVFVNEKIEHIVSLAKDGVIEAIQLHGAEDEAYIEMLKASTDKPVIKAVSIQKRGDAQKWAGVPADYLLLDNEGGGTGHRFDPGLAGRIDKPFFLAGGLDQENVAGAITTIAMELRRDGSNGQSIPFAVDVSSGVETDGYKDRRKILDFINAVRLANETGAWR